MTFIERLTLVGKAAGAAAMLVPAGLVPAIAHPGHQLQFEAGHSHAGEFALVALFVAIAGYGLVRLAAGRRR